MQVTIKQLIKELGELCDKHASIESFHYGDTLKLMKSGAIDYATVLMNISQSPMGRDITNFNIELLVLDRVITGDNECQLDVENNTNKIVRDLVSVMSYSTRWRLFSDMLAQNPVQKYYDHLPDAVTGWGVTISLQTYNDNGICDLPIFDYDYNQPISDADCDVLAIVKNTSGDFLVTKIVSDSDNVMTVPDITVIDSDGSEYQKASGVNVVCTPVADNILRPTKTGAISYVAGDDGQTQAGRNVDFFTLDFVNPYGNTTRFTNDKGGLFNDNSDGSTVDYVVDNATALGYTLNFNIPVDTMVNYLTHVQTFTLGSYSDFRVMNLNEFIPIMNNDQAWSFIPNEVIWGTTPSGIIMINKFASSTTCYRGFRNNGIISFSATTGTTFHTLYVRNHTY